MRVGSFGRVLGHSTTVRDTVEGMSDATPGPELVQPAWATAPPPSPDFPTAAAEEPPNEPDGAERRRLNTLSVAALILAVLLSPLAALFGHIAAAQISRSAGRERGAVIAWISVGLGYLWLVGGALLGYAVWQLLGL